MKRIFILILLGSLSASGIGQGHTKASEIGAFLGGSYYIGDLNPGKHFKMTRPAIGLVYRRTWNRRYSVRYNLLYGYLNGSDAKSDDPGQQLRNLNFRSHALEFSGQLEFNFFEYVPGDLNHRSSVYIFAGLGLLNFSPKANVNGDYIKLQELSTEGQKYSLNQITFPFGTGIKHNFSEKVAMTLEWGMRKTFTDYLDDVSTVYANPANLSPEAAQLADRSGGDTTLNIGRQRGNSKTKDMYSFTGIAITYLIGGKKFDCNAPKQDH